MKKILAAIALTAAPAAMFAQSALDAYQLGQSDLRGTARFMSMGGAFTALGGDLSTLNQNPAGIGVYRSSEVGATLDINMQRTTGTAGHFSDTYKQTKTNCNNFGYVGTVDLGSGSVMPFFNWGASYARTASFNRAYRGYFSSLPTSLSNYVAANTTLAGNLPQMDLSDYYSGYNPYMDSYSPWMSVLMYNALAISPTDANNGNCTSYVGLFDNGTKGTGSFSTVEEGYIDEYSINFGGNFVNMVYWGVGFGITDINYTSNTFYGESLDNALLPNNVDGAPTHGAADFDLQSWKHIYGSGFNFKAGVIVRPINELRIGLAIHTPTYYNLTYQGYATSGYNYPALGKDFSDKWVETNRGMLDEFDWKYRSPWRFMAGIAGVIGGRGIISVDYEYKAFNDMKVKDNYGDSFTEIDGDVKNYYQATNTIRVGGELRLNGNWSLRAGYSHESSPVKTAMMNGDETVYTDGADLTETSPSFTLDRSTDYITAGIGFHYQNFYLDAAYVHRARKSTYHAFDAYDLNYLEDASVPAAYGSTPTADIKDSNNSVVLSLGFRF